MQDVYFLITYCFLRKGQSDMSHSTSQQTEYTPAYVKQL